MADNDNKVKCSLSIAAFSIKTNSPEVMKSALDAVGALFGALANPVFGEPPIVAKPKQIKKPAPKE
jgi:hypothetical protein